MLHAASAAEHEGIQRMMLPILKPVYNADDICLLSNKKNKIIEG